MLWQQHHHHRHKEEEEEEEKKKEKEEARGRGEGGGAGTSRRLGAGVVKTRGLSAILPVLERERRESSSICSSGPTP